MVRRRFLDGAGVVAQALASPAVGAAWDEPSVLAGQTVGSLAGHLARGGVWAVDDYLDQEPPATATYDSPEDYYARVADSLDDAAHQAIRDRGATVAGTGWTAVAAGVAERRAALQVRLPAEPADRIVPVVGGSMLLDGFLVTRMVEQVVHLDDLARSLGVPPWPVPDDVMTLVVTTGALIGLRRRGGPAMVGALFRDRSDGVVPVL